MLKAAFKYVSLTVLFFLLTLLQVSLLSMASFFGATINGIFILFFLIVFFEPKNQYYAGFFGVLMGGFCLDLISPYPFGISIIALLIIYCLKKWADHFLVKEHITYIMMYFGILFCLAFLGFVGCLYLIHFLLGFEVSIGGPLLMNVLYNLFVACIVFFVYKNLVHENPIHNQLTLL